MKKYRSFEELEKFAIQLKIRGQKEWIEYCKLDTTPNDIPSRPDTIYKEKGWKSWGEFLGTGFVNYKDREYMPFEKARKFVHSLKLKNQKAWLDFCKSGNKPENIPSNPFKIYKKEWRGYSDWMGYTQHVRFREKKKEFRSFLASKNFIQSLNLKNLYEYRKIVKKIGEKENIPSHPERIFKKEWNGWGDFLGTGNIAATTKSKNYLPFNEAREEARKLAKKYNLTNSEDWINAVKDGKIPKNIPLKPSRVYSKIKRKYK